MLAIGITNQRETVVAWDSNTGKPLYNSILWNDTRTLSLSKEFTNKIEESKRREFLYKTGLPISTYFSALKMRWMLDNVKAVKDAENKSTLRFGTIDSWLLSNLLKEDLHATDSTNASRTNLMNIHNFEWDNEILEFYGINRKSLPTIYPSAYKFGVISKEFPFSGTEITACIGDQQSSLVGQECFSVGSLKSTFGTGNFLMMNVGEIFPQNVNKGLLITLGYHIPSIGPAKYAIEGSIATAGAALDFLVKNMGIVKDVEELNELASSVEDTNGLYFVPSFNGHLAPYWNPDARGILLGLHNGINKGNICRSILEAVAFQTNDVIEHMGTNISSIKVDGGMAASNLGMQLLSNITGLTVERKIYLESTLYGAAITAGFGSNFPIINEDLPKIEYFKPKWTNLYRLEKIDCWRDAIKRTLGLPYKTTTKTTTIIEENKIKNELLNLL